MEKIDRLGWAAGVGGMVCGLRIGVRTNDAAVVDRLKGCLPPGWAPAVSPFVDLLYSFRVGGADARRNLRHYHLLYFGMLRIARTMDLDSVFEELEGHLLPRVALLSKQFVLVHAGVVAWQGRAIVLPGYSRAGKSTLVAELLKLGAAYYSDEFAVLDDHGMVHPFARQLSLRREGGLPPRRCTAAELGAACGSEPLPVGLVAVARHRPGARWRPRRLSAGQGTWELLNCTLSARLQPEAALNVLERAGAAAVFQKGFRGEAAETAELLLREVERQGPGVLTLTAPTLSPPHWN
jgi:hypothetical protein